MIETTNEGIFCFLIEVINEGIVVFEDNNNNNNDNINDNNKGNKKDNEQIICSSSTAKFFSITDSKSILNNVFNNLNLSEEQKSSVVEYVAQKIIKKLKR